MLFLLTALMWLPQPNAQEPLVFHDRTRDIYIDGELQPGARIYYHSKSKISLVNSPDMDSLLAVFPEDNGYWVAPVPRRFVKQMKSDLQMTVAKKLSLKKGRKKATVIDKKHFVFAMSGRQFVISPHEGTHGPMTLEQLWQTVPAWQDLKENYKPVEFQLESLKAISQPTVMKVYFGTWCGDSKRSVPRLLKMLEQADNAQIKVELIAIGRGFTQPWQGIKADKITNVPTVIAERGGVEIARFVERPQGKTIGEDLAAMFENRFLARPDYRKKATLMGSGSLNHSADSGRLQAVENWKLYLQDSGGYACYSQISDGESNVRMWLVTDHTKKPQFLQITRIKGEALSRTRYSIRENSIRSTCRGNDTGIVKQDLSYGGRLRLRSASAFIDGWLAAGHKNEPGTVLDVQEQTALLYSDVPSANSRSMLQTGLGSYPSIMAQSALDEETWWFHESWGIPLQRQQAQSMAKITALDWKPHSPAKP